MGQGAGQVANPPGRVWRAYRVALLPRRSVVRDKVRAYGLDPAELVDLYVDALNDAVAGRPDDMYVGVHMCRGNFKGRYLSEGGYDDFA